MLLKKGSRGADVKRLQKGLDAMGFEPGKADGIFGSGTEGAVEEFQRRVGLWADGVFGKASLREWNELCDEMGLPQHRWEVAAPAGPAAPAPAAPVPAPAAGDPGGRLSWVSCPADKWGNGYDTFTLRADTAEAYLKVRAEVKARGGVLTSAGGKRALTSGSSPTRSKKSFHYTGRALDLALYSGFQDPAKDAYVVVPAGDRTFTVWARQVDPEAPEGASVDQVTLTCCHGGKFAKRKDWTGRAFDLTAIFRKHGFEGIPARSDFPFGGSYLGAEWWHFSWRGGMVAGETTFGAELLRVYTLAECERFLYWEEVKDAVYGVDFFG